MWKREPFNQAKTIALTNSQTHSLTHKLSHTLTSSRRGGKREERERVACRKEMEQCWEPEERATIMLFIRVDKTSRAKDS
jgi:hypothetical protein